MTTVCMSCSWSAESDDDKQTIHVKRTVSVQTECRAARIDLRPSTAVHSEPCDNKSVPTRCIEYGGDTIRFRHDLGTMLTMTDNHITYVIYYSLSRCLPRGPLATP